MTINEHAAYIRGLYDAYDLGAQEKSGKVLGEMLTLLSDMADKIGALEDENKELRDYIEELDEDLGDVEELVYGIDDEDDGDEDDGDADDDETDDDSGYYEMECPNCGETVCFDDSLDPDELVCPACGQKIGDVDFCDGKCDSCEKDCRQD